MSATREELVNECAELRVENSELREGLRREYEEGYRFAKDEDRLVAEAVESFV